MFNLEPIKIIDFIDSFLAMIFNVTQEPELQEWGNEVITGLIEDFENKITDQLSYDLTG